MKPRKIYELYKSPKGPSCQSHWYDRLTKEIWQVAAVSLKQAIYLAANDTWYGGDSGKPGIVAYKQSNNDANRGRCWRKWDDECAGGSWFKHGQTFKDETTKKFSMPRMMVQVRRWDDETALQILDANPQCALWRVLYVHAVYGTSGDYFITKGKESPPTIDQVKAAICDCRHSLLISHMACSQPITDPHRGLKEQRLGSRSNCIFGVKEEIL